MIVALPLCHQSMKLLQHKTLWENIQSFPINDPESDFPFSKKLQQKQRWTADYTSRVIAEYRRFIFLCCVLPRGASPSEAVDEAWHLHLTYTHNYWTQLCRNTIFKELHHHPSRGGPEEKEKHERWYHETLEAYLEVFEQPPPPDIWPASPLKENITFNIYDRQTLLITSLAFIILSLIFVSSFQLFSATGPEFLESYFQLCVAAIALLVYLQQKKLKLLRAVIKEHFPHNADVYQAAKFFYGPHRCYQTMLVDLIRNSEIKPVRNNFLLKGEKKQAWQTNENPLLEKLHEQVGQYNSFTYEQGIKLLSAMACDHPTFKLFQQLSKKRDFWQLIIPCITIIIGIARIIQGQLNHKPVGYLLIEILIFAVIALIISVYHSYSRQVHKIAFNIYRNEEYLDPKTDKVTASFSTAGMYALTGFAEFALLKESFKPYLEQPTYSGISSGGCGSSASPPCCMDLRLRKQRMWQQWLRKRLRGRLWWMRQLAIKN